MAGKLMDGIDTPFVDEVANPGPGSDEKKKAPELTAAQLQVIQRVNESARKGGKAPKISTRKVLADLIRRQFQPKAVPARQKKIKDALENK